MPARKMDSDCSGSRISIFDEREMQFEHSIEFGFPEQLSWKPKPYTLIKRNIYLTKKRHEDDGIFCSCASLPGSNTVCGRDCHCGVLLSSCSSSCKCGIYCVNKPFQSRLGKKLKLVETKKCGCGVVADEDIKQGEFVIEYVGEVINDKTCEERLWKMKHNGETNFYLCEINRDMVIDATYKGNKSRYINHSCSPNTEMQKWRIDGETRVGIFASRDIKKGEELTYDYQFVQFGADQDCHCGAPKCRKKLGVNKSKVPPSDDVLRITSGQGLKPLLCGRYNRNLHGGNARARPRNCIGEVVMINRHEPNNSSDMSLWSFGIIKRFIKATRKHLIMYEDGFIECLDMSKVDWQFARV